MGRHRKPNTLDVPGNALALRNLWGIFIPEQMGDSEQTLFFLYLAYSTSEGHVSRILETVIRQATVALISDPDRTYEAFTHKGGISRLVNPTLDC